MCVCVCVCVCVRARVRAYITRQANYLYFSAATFLKWYIADVNYSVYLEEGHVTCGNA